jgi:hypothetical protein
MYYNKIMSQKKAKVISIRLTPKAIDLLNKAMEESGITKTTAIEIAVRKQYSHLDTENKKES